MIASLSTWAWWVISVAGYICVAAVVVIIITLIGNGETMDQEEWETTVAMVVLWPLPLAMLLILSPFLLTWWLMKVAGVFGPRYQRDDRLSRMGKRDA